MYSPLSQAPDRFVSSHRLPRIAGALYLVIIFCGIWAEAVVRGPMIGTDAFETAQRITSAMGLFRASLLADVTMIVADITLALVFFELFRHHSRILAGAAMAFRMAQAGVISASLVLLATVPWLLHNGQAEQAFVMIQAHGMGYDLGLIFFGINSLIMASLLLRSDVPVLLAAAVATAGFVYLFGSLSRILSPEINAMMQPAYVVPLLSESALCLWLLIKGRI